MNVPESDARASSFFLFLFSAPDCWCLFTGIVVHQLWTFAFSRNHERAQMREWRFTIYLFIYFLSNWDGAPPLGIDALRRLRTLCIGSGGTVCTQKQGRRYGFWAPWTAYSLGPSCGGWGCWGVIYYRNRDCVPSQSFFPSLKSDYTVSAIKIIEFCM